MSGDYIPTYTLTIDGTKECIECRGAMVYEPIFGSPTTLETYSSGGAVFWWGEDKEGREFVPDANGKPQNVSKE